RRPPAWLPSDAPRYPQRPADTTWPASDWQLLHELLPVATPVPPHTSLRGLDILARLAGSSTDSFVSDQAVLVIGDRAAMRWRTPVVRGHTWGLLVPTTPSNAESAETLFRRIFREVALHDEALLASEPTFELRELVPVLLSYTTA